MKYIATIVALPSASAHSITPIVNFASGRVDHRDLDHGEDREIPEDRHVVRMLVLCGRHRFDPLQEYMKVNTMIQTRSTKCQ